MRQMKCSLELKTRILIALAVIVLASPVWAGKGTYRNTLTPYKSTLASAGWKVGVVYDQLAHRNDQAPSEHSVNQSIGKVLKEFSKEDADKVTLEAKREVSRIAREAMAKGFKDKRTTLRTGITGFLRYRVGVFEYKRYYVPGKGEWQGGSSHEQFRLAPIIALMPKDPVPMKEAKIHVFNVPADSELFLDGEPTRQKGYSRHCTTPKLEVGKMYSYKILVRWKKDGKTQESTARRSISGGDDIEIDFRIYGGVAKD